MINYHMQQSPESRGKYGDVDELRKSVKSVVWGVWWWR
jgi:hypothetical protein